MMFMSRDGIVLVTITGLGWFAYVKRGNPVSSCPPFLLTFFGFITLRGGIHVTNV
ncbi:hypothetical protein HanHA300_Chr08g0297151 [Helianthus annuus]|nr:hypothetical protein HanHA300_Chr08g0297151 [Helianthus annuus]KAJ0555080.1 hypothetical protein HanHA89_Chr08g0315641 [Helianthus annuus]KAJ0720647.1 hypothetical protein HanLR1_Chr08g0296001 [Helianthus annuus]